MVPASPRRLRQKYRFSGPTWDMWSKICILARFPREFVCPLKMASRRCPSSPSLPFDHPMIQYRGEWIEHWSIWQGPGLQNEGLVATRAKFPHRVHKSVLWGGQYETSPCADFADTSRRVAWIYQQTSAARSTGMGGGVVIRIVWDDFPPFLSTLGGGVQPENPPSTHLTKFRIFPTYWKIFFVLFFWIKHILFYLLGLRWFLFCFPPHPQFLL